MSKKGALANVPAVDALGAALAQKSAASSHHQFAIDEEGLVARGAAGARAGEGTRQAARVRKEISFEEYLKRKKAGTL